MISFLCPNSWLMSGDLAVVMDVAGTIMRMYRVAKDIPGDIILEKVVTWELIMEKSGRALVVPQIDPDMIISCNPDHPIRVLVLGREDCIKISCSSSQISPDEVSGQDARAAGGLCNSESEMPGELSHCRIHR